MCSPRSTSFFERASAHDKKKRIGQRDASARASAPGAGGVGDEALLFGVLVRGAVVVVGVLHTAPRVLFAVVAAVVPGDRRHLAAVQLDDGREKGKRRGDAVDLFWGDESKTAFFSLPSQRQKTRTLSNRRAAPRDDRSVVERTQKHSEGFRARKRGRRTTARHRFWYLSVYSLQKLARVLNTSPVLRAKTEGGGRKTLWERHRAGSRDSVLRLQRERDLAHVA